MTFLDPSAYVRNNPDDIIKEFDPFSYGVGLSASRTKAFYRVWIGGYEESTMVEVTANLEPHLISVHVTDSLSTATCEIELDDRYGTLPIPPLSSPCVVMFGWLGQSGQEVFWGVIQDIEHGCSRGQSAGRRLWIHAFGENYNSPGKEPQQAHLGEGAGPGESEGQQIPFTDAINKFAAAAGHTALINKKLQSIKRDYWDISNESFLNWASRVTDELGLLFRVTHGTQAEFTTPDERADGTSGIIQATYGDNLIGWRLHPAAARPAWSESKQQFFDTRKAIWKGVSSMIGASMPAAASSAGYSPSGSASGEGVANQQASGTGNFISLTPEPGRVVIVGEPAARAGYYLHIVGARPGVDGIWFMKEVEHLYSRAGYITWCDVWYPVAPDNLVASRVLAQANLPSYAEMQADLARSFTVDPNAFSDLLAGQLAPITMQQIQALLGGIQNSPPEQAATAISKLPPEQQAAVLDALQPAQQQAIKTGASRAGIVIGRLTGQASK